MNANNPLTQQHSLVNGMIFRLKVSLLTGKRLFKNLFSRDVKYRKTAKLSNYPVLSISESELWNTADNEQNWILTAGKVQNLRIAVRRLNGLEIPAHQTFSFWKHIGNPNLFKGYVVGREIREGCLVPSVAGGLCQLSNALYDAALQANFNIIERHRHSQVIKGSLAERDRDATVKWNYVDLRFKSPAGFRIEIELTAGKLLVSFRGAPVNGTAIQPGLIKPLPSSKLNDCYSCGNLQCHNHPECFDIERKKAITTFILDDKWPEYDEYIKGLATETDSFIVPLLQNKFLKSSRYNWTIKNKLNVKPITFATLNRALMLRFAAKTNNNIFKLMLRLDKKVAMTAAGKIAIESTHLVISQNLLPFLWEAGVLGGRTFDVLMTRLPMEHLHNRLNSAHANHPESTTLNDFRASQQLIDMENAALTNARHIITPHQEIADIFNNKSVKLAWVLPKTKIAAPAVNTRILFPASSLGRKGAYEIRRLAIDLHLTIVVTGKATEGGSFWTGINTEDSEGDIFNDIALIVYPAYVENQPRVLLRGIAANIPVIVTAACGLSPLVNVTIVPTGDYFALKGAVLKALHRKTEPNIMLI